MSGSCEIQECPRCGGHLKVSLDSDPMCCCGQCFDCGYGYSTQEYQASLKELNQERGACGMMRLSEFVKPTWSKECEKQYRKDTY